MLFKSNSDQTTRLFRALQWLLTSLRVKAEVLPLSRQALTSPHACCSSHSWCLLFPKPNLAPVSGPLHLLSPLPAVLLQVSTWLTRHLLPGSAQVPPSQQSLPWPSCFKWHPPSPSPSILYPCFFVTFITFSNNIYLWVLFIVWSLRVQRFLSVVHCCFPLT